MDKDAELYENLASCHGFLNENESALNYQRKYLNLAPDDLFGWSIFGWLCYKTNNLHEGIETLHSILARYGPDGNLYVGLGNLYTAGYEYDNAKKYYTFAISIARESKQNLLGSIYLYNRSILEETFYNFDDAYKDTVSSLNAASRSSGFLMQGELELRRLEFQTAFSRYQKAYSLDSTPLASLGLADTLIQAGYVEEAEPYLDAIVKRKDMSWIANYGTTPDQFLADRNRIQRDRYTILKNRESRKVIHKLSTALVRTATIISYTAHLWYYNGLFRIYNKRVAQYYEKGGETLQYNAFYYRTFNNWPIIGRTYLSRAKEIEVSAIPQAEAAYLYEKARMNRDPEAYRDAIRSLNPEWERNFIAKALSSYIFLLQKDNLRIEPEAIQTLLQLQPASFLLYNLSLPVSLDIQGGSIKENRYIRRSIKKAGFYIVKNSAYIVTIKISEDSLTGQCTNLHNEPVCTQFIHRGDSLKADSSKLINNMVDHIYRSPLGS